MVQDDASLKYGVSFPMGVHAGIWSILGLEGSYVLTFGPIYVPYRYLDPLGLLYVLIRW